MGRRYDILLWTSEKISCAFCEKLKGHGVTIESKVKGIEDLNICDDCAGQSLVRASRRRSRR